MYYFIETGKTPKELDRVQGKIVKQLISGKKKKGLVELVMEQNLRIRDLENENEQTFLYSLI